MAKKQAQLIEKWDKILSFHCEMLVIWRKHPLGNLYCLNLSYCSMILPDNFCST